MPASTEVPQVALDLSRQLLEQAARQQAQEAEMLRRVARSPEEAAAQSLLNKSAKLEVARQAVLVQDLAALAEADREKVRRLEEMRVFGKDPGPSKAGDDVGPIIVCDDYNASRNAGQQPRPAASAAAMTLAGLVAGGGIALAALALFAPKTAPAPTAASAVQYEKVTEVQQPDGSWKETKREPLK